MTGTSTDSAFTSRFSGVEATTFVANQKAMAEYTPASSPLNTGMMSDIGRATIYGPESQDNFFSKFMKQPLGRGDSVMTARFGEVTSRAYSPTAPDTDLFNGQKPAMTSNVATKNLSRQIATEVNDYVLKQFVQTDEMIGDAMAAIMSASNVCYLDDMWVSSKEYFSGSTRSALDTQVNVLTNDIGDDGFGAELNELLWKITQKDFGYKSTLYNASGANTKSPSVMVALNKSTEYRAFNKLLSETFNPEFLNVAINGGIDYVDSFATPAGKPTDSGDLLAIVVDPRAFEITPMPGTLMTESFRNPARHSTAYFTTYEYAFQHNGFFNCEYVFAPAESA